MLPGASTLEISTCTRASAVTATVHVRRLAPPPHGAEAATVVNNNARRRAADPHTLGKGKEVPVLAMVSWSKIGGLPRADICVVLKAKLVEVGSEPIAPILRDLCEAINAKPGFAE